MNASRITAVLLASLLINYSTAVTGVEVTFDWASVGNPGNLPDQVYTSNNPRNLRFGAVADTYRISKYEVTNQQYVAFLNAVDPSGANLFSLFNSQMESDNRGGISLNAAGTHGSKYLFKANMANKPVNYVSFFDSLRFINWLENDQPVGGGGTEAGSYTIGTGVNETRTAGARYFLPTDNEWYKAAYYDPRNAAEGGPAGDDHYWLYPTRSDSTPAVAAASVTGDISNPGVNVANYNAGAIWNGVPVGSNGNVTTVGSAGGESASFYGTFDQGGNVREWTEAVLSSQFRNSRGGFIANSAHNLSAASMGAFGPPANEDYFCGFRVVNVPEPTALADFDNDGDVDGSDFLKWQRGESSNPLSAVELATWKSNFGQTSIVTVPEPSSIAMTLMGTLGIIQFHRLIAWRKQP